MVVGIPVHREREWLPHTLAALALQTRSQVSVWVIVNQPAYAEGDADGVAATAENEAILAFLRQQAPHYPFPLHVIDAIHPPQRPPAKKAGVGWARDQVFRQAIGHHGEAALCVSLDADTLVAPGYLAAVDRQFADQPNAVGLAVPYYHPLPRNQRAARHILRYEIYLRYYQLNLWRIGSPYAFCPLGSAIAFRAAHFGKIRGFPHRQAGEDFYFLQQLTKTGQVLRWCDEWVYPAARSSDRTPYGTGPVIGAPNLHLQEQRFPFLPLAHFDRLAVTMARFGDLYDRDVPTPIDEYLNQHGGRVVFAKLRRNHTSRARFIRACHEWLDGLRTLQCLRWHLNRYGGQIEPLHNLDRLLTALGEAAMGVDLAKDPIPHLLALRDRLFALECEYQCQSLEK